MTGGLVWKVCVLNLFPHLAILPASRLYSHTEYLYIGRRAYSVSGLKLKAPSFYISKHFMCCVINIFFEWLIPHNMFLQSCLCISRGGQIHGARSPWWLNCVCQCLKVWSLEWNLLLITLLAPRVVRWLLGLLIWTELNWVDLYSTSPNKVHTFG